MSGDSNVYVPSVSPMKKSYSISKAAPHFLLKQNPYIYFQIVCGTVVVRGSVWYSDRVVLHTPKQCSILSCISTGYRNTINLNFNEVLLTVRLTERTSWLNII